MLFVNNHLTIKTLLILVGFVSGWFDAVRAFMFLGVFALIAVLVVAILYAFVMKDKQILLFVTIGLAFVAGK